LTALLEVESPGVVPPQEMIESENLVLRQAHSLVISSDDDYTEAGRFLNEVIVAGRNQVHDLFDPHVDRAFAAHRALTSDRNKHLEPWEQAEKIVKAARVTYFQKEEARRDSERRERERAAKALDDERKRQEAEAERQRATEEAQRRREEAEARRIAAEAEAEKLRNLAAEQASDAARRDAERRAMEIEATAKREAEVAEATASAIAEAGEAAAQAIEQEPTHVELPSAPAQRLGGVTKTWGVDKENWDAVAFAEWIAVDPKSRARYIGAPAWPLLAAEAKQQKSLFCVGGITAGPKFSGRAGK
jgi:hypothetical protein